MVELPRSETFAGSQNGLRVVAKGDTPLPAATTTVETAMVPRRRNTFRVVVLSAALLGGAAFAAQTAYQNLVINRFIEETDNAYVKADSTAVAPKVSGYIKEVLVDDNDVVVAGQPLANIDDRDFQIALLQAKAELEAADAAIRNVVSQITLQQSLVDQADAALKSSKAALTFARTEAERSEKLITTGAGTLSRAEQTASARDQADAAVARDEANVIATRNRIPVLETQKNQATAQRHRVEAQVAQAELNLSYTRITAPVDGVVGAKTLRVGQLVNAGTQLMAVVPLHSIYVVANFKETQLTSVKAGQPVSMSIDSFPGIKVSGHVDSLSPGSGSEFSLLPTDNATGNFTKIVQRIPVKISVDEGVLTGQLRPGMSVISRIDTSDGGTYTDDLWSDGR